MKFIAILLLLVSCSSRQDLSSLRKDTQKILNQFNYYHLKYTGKISPKIYIGMVESKDLRHGKILATCRYTPSPHIVIRREVWEDSSYEEKEYILFHELGHCILNRRHDNDIAGEKPLSIMFNGFKKEHLFYFNDDRNSYLLELFSHSDHN